MKVNSSVKNPTDGPLESIIEKDNPKRIQSTQLSASIAKTSKNNAHPTDVRS